MAEISDRVIEGQGQRFSIVNIGANQAVTFQLRDAERVIIEMNDTMYEPGTLLNRLLETCKELNRLHETTSARLGDNTTLDEGFRLG